MTFARVSDLDELVLAVRDVDSKKYIFEAVQAYRGGALRSAIIATWIAVAYDIITKIRELAQQGDKQAVDWVKKLDNVLQQAKEDERIRRLQNIERALLEDAHNQFEFLTRHQYEDLQRLKHDRNLCAHPAFVVEDTLFQPTPDLVRTHIVHAILHLLREHPVQGKSAIARIMTDIRQPSFPRDRETIAQFMNERYLDRAKDSLIRGLVDIVIKTVLRGDNPDFIKKEPKLVCTLEVISHRHPKLYEELMSVKLKGIVDGLDDERILSVCQLIRVDPRCWNWISQSAQIRITEIIRQFKAKDVSDQNNHRIFDLLDVESIKPILIDIFNKFEPGTQQNVIAKNPRPEFTGRAIQLYAEAERYRRAESLGRSVILPMLPYLSADDVIQIINVARDDRQIWQASGTEDILLTLFDETKTHFHKTSVAWKGFVENIFRSHEEYSTYPQLQAKLRESGIDLSDQKAQYSQKSKDESAVAD